MAFNVYSAVEDELEDEVLPEAGKRNRVPYKNFDLSGFTVHDKVGLIDGDWLAYSVCCTLSPWDEDYVAKGRINKKIAAFVEASG